MGVCSAILLQEEVPSQWGLLQSKCTQARTARLHRKGEQERLAARQPTLWRSRSLDPPPSFLPPPFAGLPSLPHSPMSELSCSFRAASLLLWSNSLGRARPPLKKMLRSARKCWGYHSFSPHPSPVYSPPPLISSNTPLGNRASSESCARARQAEPSWPLGGVAGGCDPSSPESRGNSTPYIEPPPGDFTAAALLSLQSRRRRRRQNHCPPTVSLVFSQISRRKPEKSGPF